MGQSRILCVEKACPERTLEAELGACQPMPLNAASRPNPPSARTVCGNHLRRPCRIQNAVQRDVVGLADPGRAQTAERSYRPVAAHVMGTGHRRIQPIDSQAPLAACRRGGKRLLGRRGLNEPARQEEDACSVRLALSGEGSVDLLPHIGVIGAQDPIVYAGHSAYAHFKTGTVLKFWVQDIGTCIRREDGASDQDSLGRDIQSAFSGIPVEIGSIEKPTPLARHRNGCWQVV